jgi:hypothetical protein
MIYHGPRTKALITLNKKAETPITYIETFAEYHSHDEVKATLESLLGLSILEGDDDYLYYGSKIEAIGYKGRLTEEEDKQLRALLHKAYDNITDEMKIFLKDVVQLDKNG